MVEASQCPRCEDRADHRGGNGQECTFHAGHREELCSARSTCTQEVCFFASALGEKPGGQQKRVNGQQGQLEREGERHRAGCQQRPLHLAQDSHESRIDRDLVAYFTPAIEPHLQTFDTRPQGLDLGRQ